MIGAFSAEQAKRLSGVSGAQLRLWHTNHFLPASFANERSRSPFSRIYSFKDVVTLRVLHQLRNIHKVSMPELRKVAEMLSDLGSEKWTSFRFWVHNRKVVFREPDTRRPREITSNQYIVELGLEVEVTSAHRALAEMNSRESQFGRIEKSKFVAHRQPIIAGTRIPVSAVTQFAEAGYSTDQIVAEYPSLTAADVLAALAYGTAKAA